MDGMNFGMMITIVNRTNSRCIELAPKTQSWADIMDEISKMEGYLPDEYPKWVISDEFVTGRGIRIAAFQNGSDSTMVIVHAT